MFTAYLSVGRGLVDASPHLSMRVRGTRLYLMLIRIQHRQNEYGLSLIY